MITVRIEHPIKSFAAWKAAFDRDPVDRRRSGVRRYVVMQPVDDADFVLVDLDFGTEPEAAQFVEAMRRLWSSPAAAGAFAGDPRARIVRTVESSLDDAAIS